MLETSLNDHEIGYHVRRGHLLDLHTSLSDHLSGTTAAQKPEAELLEAFGEWKEAGLVVDGEKRWGGINAAVFVHWPSTHQWEPRKTFLWCFLEEMETDAHFRRIFDFGTTAASGCPRRSPAKKKRLSVSE